MAGVLDADELRALFLRLDADGSGSVSVAELTAGLQREGLRVPNGFVVMQLFRPRNAAPTNEVLEEDFVAALEGQTHAEIQAFLDNESRAAAGDDTSITVTRLISAAQLRAETLDSRRDAAGSTREELPPPGYRVVRVEQLKTASELEALLHAHVLSERAAVFNERVWIDCRGGECGALCVSAA